jgi:hypothetical protein
MFSYDMNKSLWRDEALFDLFLKGMATFAQAISRDRWDPAEFQLVANFLDEIMQQYERKHGSIEDPIFYHAFATSNAMFLQTGKKLDEVGSARIAYIVNGYKEGLTKHLLYPSFPATMIEVAFDNMEQFANNEDKKWVVENKPKFRPIAD